jgi:glutathione S-transferase
MTALHLGTEVDLVVVDLAKGAQRKPEFVRLNPNGKVPVLDDDGFVLWESNAIMQYLADKTPGQTIYPTDLRARADVNRWLSWSAHHFAPSIGVLGWENMVKRIVGAGEPDPFQVKRGEALVVDCAAVLDEHLSGRRWVLGDRLTLADYALAAPLMAIGPAKLPVTAFTHLMDWFGRVQELDAWKKTSL